MDKDNVVHVHNGILFSHIKNEILPLATAWMELEIHILCKLDLTHMWNLRVDLIELRVE
jgi:hypothetical protein